MTPLTIGLCVTSGLAVATGALWVTERLRARRSLLAWWDIPLTALALYLGLLSAIGWCWCLAGVIR